MTDEQIKKQLRDIASQIADKVAEKNVTYNRSFDRQMAKFGPPALIIRLYDKMERLEALHKQNRIDAFGETWEDTLIDMIGYCLLELRRRGWGVSAE